MQITLEWGIVISALTACFTAYKVILAVRKDKQEAITKDTSFSSTVMSKLDGISGDLQELKRDIRDVKSDISAHAERIAKLEARLEQIYIGSSEVQN